MDPKPALNKKYLNLCQQLGDAQYKLDQLKEHISSLKDQIASLDRCFPLVQEILKDAQDAGE